MIAHGVNISRVFFKEKSYSIWCKGYSSHQSLLTEKFMSLLIEYFDFCIRKHS